MPLIKHVQSAAFLKLRCQLAFESLLLEDRVQATPLRTFVEESTYTVEGNTQVSYMFINADYSLFRVEVKEQSSTVHGAHVPHKVNAGRYWQKHVSAC